MTNKTFSILDENKIKKTYYSDLPELSPFDIGIPLLDISDSTIEEIYYYRWHSYCNQIKPTENGYVVTEFLPEVPWAGKYNTIPCAAGHHFYEGRWLHNQEYINSYAKFWFSPDSNLRKYSGWIANALLSVAKITGDFSNVELLYEDLKQNFKSWQEEKQTENGLFYQTDNFDGMEFSAGGSGLRPTINSYMYGELLALYEIAKLLNKNDQAKEFLSKAEELKERINSMLWDDDAEFYKTLDPESKKLVSVREFMGYVPWYFNLPSEEKTVAWKFLNDKNYFYAPFGPTTTEQNHPDFMKPFDHECLWNGPSWPFATSQTLTALGNLLCNYEQSVMQKKDYYNLLHLYANSQYLNENGNKTPFIDENLDPFTGEWIARNLLKVTNKPDKGPIDRGRHYNHSTFCDLVLSGLAGVRGCENDKIIINPLFDEENLSFLCVDGIKYHGNNLCIVWDKTGERYGIGKGFKVLVNSEIVFSSQKLCKFAYEFNN